MATYNGVRYLAAQIDSILAQLGPGDELLVADDGSTDDTLGLLAGYGPALRVVATTRVGGVVANFSRVLGEARGDLILLADQDDVWLAGRVDAMRSALCHCDLVLTNAQVCDEALRPTGATLFGQIGAASGFWHNLLRNSFVGCCMGFRRELLQGVLPVPPMTPWHDWLIGLVGCLRGRVCLLDTPWLLYRRHGSNTSATGEASRNRLWRKIALRVAVLRALHICRQRARRRPVPMRTAA